jgi:protoheme IX farnesyltransferase
VTGEIHNDALLLFLIIFVWTPPHFWALAIAKKDDYAKVGIPMLPVTHGGNLTKLFILLYTVLLVLITVLPYSSGMSGLIYLVTALVLGSTFLLYAVRLRKDTGTNLPMRVFRYSINYLMILFAALLIDHYFIIRIDF